MKNNYGESYPFDMDDILERCQNGSMPDGYLEAFLARQRRLHAALHSQIKKAIEAAEELGKDSHFRF